MSATISHGLITIQAQLKAPKTAFNKHSNFHYRSFESILEGVKPLLAQHGCQLHLQDSTRDICGIPVITATATFIDGDGVVVVVSADAGVDINRKGMDTAQAFGSASSYARKYALNGLFLIDDSKDPDSDAFVDQKAKEQKEYEDRLQREHTQALRDINTAANKDILVNASNYFSNTKYSKVINTACRAKADQEGW